MNSKNQNLNRGNLVTVIGAHPHSNKWFGIVIETVTITRENYKYYIEKWNQMHRSTNGFVPPCFLSENKKYVLVFGNSFNPEKSDKFTFHVFLLDNLEKVNTAQMQYCITT